MCSAGHVPAVRRCRGRSQGREPRHLRNADALHRQRCFIRHIANLLAMLAGLAGQASLNGRTDREATRLPVDEWFAVISHQSGGSRTSARNDQPPAATEATATSGQVAVAAGCVSRERRGAAAAAQQEELIRRSLGQSPASRTGNAVPQAHPLPGIRHQPLSITATQGDLGGPEPGGNARDFGQQTSKPLT